MARAILLIVGLIFAGMLLMGCSDIGQNNSSTGTAERTPTITTIQTPPPTTAIKSIIGRYQAKYDKSRIAELYENGELTLNDEGFISGTWEKGIFHVNINDLSQAYVGPGEGFVITAKFSELKARGPVTIKEQVAISDSSISFLESDWIKI